MKKAIIFGSTGLTGAALVRQILLIPQYGQIICFVRKQTDSKHDNINYIISDFSDLENYGAMFENADVYCCLGTTIKKVNYNKEKFKEVDLYLPLKIANNAKKYHAQQFLIMSSIGADAKSKIFYSRVKGELEDSLKALNLSALHIFQPSMLLGDRKENRLGEKIAAVLSNVFRPLFIGGLKKYKPITAQNVANAMLHIASKNTSGTHIYTSNIIQQIADASFKH